LHAGKHSGFRELGAAVGEGGSRGKLCSLAIARRRFPIQLIWNILAYVYILEFSDE
jgi:hypothetical protein